MKNKQVIELICEQHSKEVILSAAIQTIAFIISGKHPTEIHLKIALSLMEHTLDVQGVELSSILDKSKMKA